MGTRNLTVAVIEGKHKIAQYGQWEGYPEGQGKTILEFLKTWDRPAFETKLRATRFVSDLPEKEREKMIETVKAKGNNWPEHYPELTRDTGAEILGIVARAPVGIILKDTISFASDSLMCEFGYVLDLDKNVLEVYTGFNKSALPPEARFANVEREKDASPDYHPIRIKASYPLGALPTLDHMVADCEREEGDPGVFAHIVQQMQKLAAE